MYNKAKTKAEILEYFLLLSSGNITIKDLNYTCNRLQHEINNYKMNVPLADISIEEIEKCFNNFKEKNNVY